LDGFLERQALKLRRCSQLSAPEGNQDRIKFVIDVERRLVIAKFGEGLTVADIQGYVLNLSAHPSFDASFSEIADISDLKDLPLEACDFVGLADRIDPFSLESKRAFVAKTSLQQHAARIHKVLRNQRHFEIFQTREEAERWINS
jgi:hypothetical protein